ncbi:MAG: SAM-dependent methyltransferase [Rhodospirillales bacterium]|nr:SAM-dependent methyltransferase [Rhodospirillales bacterium]
MALDDAKLNDFVGKMVGDMGAAMGAALMVVGDKLGLYKQLATGKLNSEELARRTGTTERYVREWLAAQAAAGYVDFDPVEGRFSLSPEQAMVFANESSPVFMPGFADMIQSLWRDEPKITEAFRTGKGVGWHEHDSCLFRGTERFFRPGYAANLVESWLPALDGMVEKLRSGARVADVGCGHGASTVIMAKAFPNSEFVGFDYHAPSVEHASRAAKDEGLHDNVRFVVAAAKDFPGHDYDLVAFFDCLHDMGDPVGAALHVRQSLRPDGSWMVVEPFANDSLADNLNPVGRIFYAASTMVCTPASLSQEVGLGLGAQAGEARLRDVIMQGGFTRFRRATETPFNLVLEARP